MTVGPVARDQATAGFFDGTANGQFLLRHCPSCGAVSAPQAAQCERCAATDLDWQAARGDATLISWTVAHGRPGTDPVVACIAELAEGPWWWSCVEDCSPDQLRPGAPLRIEFRRSGPQDETVPVFTLIAEVDPSLFSRWDRGGQGSAAAAGRSRGRRPARGRACAADPR